MRLIGVSVLFLLPAAVILAVWQRLRWKERSLRALGREVEKVFSGAGWQPLEEGRFRRNEKGFKFELSTNPLFSRSFTLRLAAGSPTLHEFELRKGSPVPPEFRAFAPLLDRWASAGKMYSECYAAGVVDGPPCAEDLELLARLAQEPLEKAWRGGIFTLREGFEKDVPQWHWRHDQRPRLPKAVQRYCVSYWTGSPLLNPPLVRLFERLSEGWPMFYLCEGGEDLRCLEDAFGAADGSRKGALLRLRNPAMPVAADLHTDGGFFGGLLVARERPGGFDDEAMPRRAFHDAALGALESCRLYARRLWDDEFSWYSGEYEIVSVSSLDVPGALAELARDMGAEVREIDRRFHKRIVQPLEY
jgi:hypothetical protein